MVKKEIPHEEPLGPGAVAGRLRALDREIRHGVLATDAGGQPCPSRMAPVLSPDLTGLLFVIPRDTQKYPHLADNPKISL